MVDVSEVSQPDDKANLPGSSSVSWVTSMLCLFFVLAFLVGGILILTQQAKPDDGEEPVHDSDKGSSSGPSADNSSPFPQVVNKRPVTTAAASITNPGASGSAASGSAASGSAADQSPASTDLLDPSVTTDSTSTTTMRTKLPYTGPTVKPGLFVCYMIVARWREMGLMEDGFCDVVIADETCGKGPRFDTIPSEFPALFNRSKNDVKTKYGITACARSHGVDDLEDTGDCDYAGRVDLESSLPESPDYVIDTLPRLLTRTCSYPVRLKDPEDMFQWPEIVEAFQKMAQHNMRYFGFGMLGFQSEKLTAAAFTVAEKVVADYFAGKGSTVFTALRSQMSDYEQLVSIARAAKVIPNMFIIPGTDVELPNKLTDRALLPAINLYRPSTRYYRAYHGRTLADTAQMTLSLIKQKLAEQIILVMSFGAKTERMLFPDNLNDNIGRYAIYQPAVFFPVEENEFVMCNASDPEYLRNLQYQENAATWVTYNKGLRIERSYTLDTPETLRFKLCNFFVNYTDVKEHLNFGLTDLDYDSYNLDCRKFKLKPYDRVKMLKAMREFYYKEYWDPSDLYFCLRVTP